ncbi:MULTISPECIES: RNA polymerase factor sigma-54 [Prosthecochloris]|uniref:RNA polymerase sigma-54 factor n=1 Tax=Prosthecochloris marina TaxID=2017681 RepID=A0A317T913_9CHLB|nr:MULTISPECIES: RNA polymerase factor sigma-54 [Prosthecochloris]PWW83182.1 RNA polymerase sigma-54 factor [Prosthecochloris marina]UZJ38800.1 RNA polymerase factor sigma-54 [Prosthecochloris sp. SCSIO W1103]
MPDIKLQQSQRTQLSSQQIMTSQLLQLPLMHLEQRIFDELQDNPMLELEEQKGESVDDSGGKSGDEPEEGMFDSVDRFEKDGAGETDGGKKDDQEGRLQFTIDNRPKESFIQAVQQDSCEEKLLKDLSLQEGIGTRELLIAIEILGNLDDDGYLKEDFPVIVYGLGQNGIEVDEWEVKSILKRIQYLDPPGIGVHNLQERLLIQLEAKTGRDKTPSDTLALHILAEHYDDFLNNRYERILKQLQISPSQLESAITVISTLDPHPFVAGVSADEYIVPDFIVTYENGRLTAVLNDRSNMTVHVSGEYQDVLKSRGVPTEDRKYMRQKLSRAKEFASAIAQRRNTLIKVIEALMNFQYDFFVTGPEKLVPLVMKDVAEKTGFDLSTISRAVNGKYVQTRFGTFELKYFFSGSLPTEEGEDLSTKIIKQYIKELIDAEDSAKPLNDDKLAKMLEEKGIKIARRTVAKYREQMQIPVARLRKKIF